MSAATSTNTNVAETVDSYLASLAEADGATRSTLLARAFIPECRYSDPHHDLAGYEAFDAAIVNVVTAYPGFRFQRTTGIDAHHEFVRFGWEFRGPDGSVPLAGMDVGVLANDGRLEAIVGFHGELPAA